MKYFAEFDADGNKTAGYVADGMPYTEADIRERLPNAVEISEADFELYNAGYIRGADDKPKEKPSYVPTLDEQKVVRLQQIDTWTAASITGGFVSLASDQAAKYDSDKDDQSNLMLMLQAAQSPDFATHPIYQGKIPLRAVPVGQTEKVVLQHDATQMRQVVDDMALHIGACKQKGWQLQAAVAAATTAEEVEAIKWPDT